jgi:serine/threonine-protein kinase
VPSSYSVNVNYEGDPGDAITRLKQAMPVYEAIQHPNLTRLIDHGPYGDGYAAVFAWAEGE